jgi:hypothetical protein
MAELITDAIEPACDGRFGRSGSGRDAVLGLFPAPLFRYPRKL